MVAVLTLVWHQTRTVERLRKEVRADHKHLLRLHEKATRQARRDNRKLRTELRAEFTKSHDTLRADFSESHGKLWDAVIQNSRKLDRIEGFLGIGTPPAAADRAPGAALRHSPPPQSTPPAPGDPPDEPGPGEPRSEAEADPDG